MNVERISCADLMPKRTAYVFVDVRSPTEFARGHVPGAHNIPLFSDALRALVGTMYVQEGKDRALAYALEHVGPHLHELVAQARAVYVDKPLCVYCARGGMRSASVAWLFDLFKIRGVLMAGGYKAFRNWAGAQFETTKQVHILAGKTGAGKTEYLKTLASDGAQVIDLEGLARHRGSVFGGSFELQATQQQFENDLAVAWFEISAHTPVWVEDESRKIGAVIIPEGIWRSMKNAPVYVHECLRGERLARIIAQYGQMGIDELMQAAESIRQPLGNERCECVLVALRENNIPLAADLLLDYYDRLYEYNLAQKNIVGKL